MAGDHRRPGGGGRPPGLPGRPVRGHPHGAGGGWPLRRRPGGGGEALRALVPVCAHPAGGTAPLLRVALWADGGDRLCLHRAAGQLSADRLRPGFSDPRLGEEGGHVPDFPRPLQTGRPPQRQQGPPLPREDGADGADARELGRAARLSARRGGDLLHPLRLLRRRPEGDRGIPALPQGDGGDRPLLKPHCGGRLQPSLQHRRLQEGGPPVGEQRRLCQPLPQGQGVRHPRPL